MQDSLTVGLLHRLDTLAAKAGIAGGQLWDLWLATWWRPMIPVVITGVLVLICLPLFFKNLKIANNRSNDDEIVISAGITSVICAIVGAVSLLILLLSLPDAMTYALNHQLYALDQLRQVIGR